MGVTGPAPSGERRVVLITGCSSGIGLEAAVAFGQRGWHVVATMRDLGRAGALTERLEGERALPGSVELRRLDVTDPGGMAECVNDVVGEHGAIDVLVNNAGSGFLGSLEHLSIEQLTGVMDVDFLGVARLTKLVLPLQRARGRGRIITVTSVGGVVGQPFNDAYCAAKFAVEGLMECLAPVAAAHGVQLSLVEPGPVATSFVATAASTLGEWFGDPDDPYRKEIDGYLERATATFSLAQDPAKVADVIVRAATEEAPAFRYQTSAASSQFVSIKLGDLDGSRVIAETSSWIS